MKAKEMFSATINKEGYVNEVRGKFKAKDVRSYFKSVKKALESKI
tara:strand:- start:1199 stop:1333 length:135 start_codon:yes stop_codon:yes gene_type:complete